MEKKEHIQNGIRKKEGKRWSVVQKEGGDSHLNPT